MTEDVQLAISSAPGRVPMILMNRMSDAGLIVQKTDRVAPASFGADVGLRSRSQNRTARSFTPVRQSVATEFRSGDADAFVA